MSATRCCGICNADPRTSTPITFLFEATPPAGRLLSGDGISSVVKHALKRATIDAPAKGAHLLRHTAATEMLRNGVPLDQAGLVLRHRSIDMTAYYAKADVALLKQIAQPWPEVNG
jgi:site-specific recombinase XerD